MSYLGAAFLLIFISLIARIRRRRRQEIEKMEDGPNIEDLTLPVEVKNGPS